MIDYKTTEARYKSLVFLHLSDIHFRKGLAGSSHDLDKDLRSQLESDAKLVVRQIGSVNAVLITGDIAFSGAKEEYCTAKSWLDELVKIVNCEPPVILTVPGNHDVDQAIYENDVILQSTLGSIIACGTDDGLNHKIQQVCSSPRSEAILYGPIQNYNVFASELGCELGHQQQGWTRDFLLENDIAVRINGLNSTLGSRKDDKRASNLFLGLRQVQIQDESRTLNISMCHHPPDWLKDTDQVEDYLGDRVHVQLFGHKHRQRLTRISGKLRVTAGAVHPDRREPGWIPRYNFIELTATSNDSVTVKIYPRVWNKTRFVADTIEAGGREFSEEKFYFEPTIADKPAQSVDEPLSFPSQQSLIISDLSEKIIIETSMILDEEITMSAGGIEYGKILVRRFMNLTEDSRDKLIRELGLDDPELHGTGDLVVLKEVFVRAKQRKLLDQLWENVEREHADNMFSENPFSKG